MSPNGSKENQKGDRIDQNGAKMEPKTTQGLQQKYCSGEIIFFNAKMLLGLMLLGTGFGPQSIKNVIGN